MRQPEPGLAPYRLAADTLGADEIAAAKAVLDSGMLTMGKNVAAFEHDFAAWTGAKHAVMTNSGSSANLIAVDAMLRRSRQEPVWRPGDEVLVPALAWPTTVWPLAQLGLVPVFVDVDRATMAIDLDSAESALSGKTRGMFLIHALGRAADMDRYVAFCARHELTLLEDSCESLGAHSGGSHVGRFGPVASFSCYFSHHISTIEGGVVITDDDGLRDDLVSLRAHGWLRDRSDRQYWTDLHPDLDPRFLFVHAGYNVRPMELQAAIGRVQLARLDQMLTARETLARNVGAWVAASAPWLELIGSECLDVPPRTRRERRHSWMTFPFRLRADAPASIEQVKAWLETRGVETRPIIAGNLTRHPALARFEHRVVPDLAASNELLQRGFMIGCHPTPAPGTLDTLEQALLSLADMPEKVRPRT